MSKEPKLKIPPHNVEAEQSVLGSLLIDKNAIIKVADLLLSKDFYTPAHELIYENILALFEKHQPIDIVSLTNRLKEQGLLKDIGGSSYLAELTNQVATASHIDHFATIVKEKKSLRDLIRAAGKITEDAFDTAQDVEELLDASEQIILSISQKSRTQSFIPIKNELQSAYERIEKLHENKGSLRGLTTGFTDLDTILAGLQKSDLIILGARPSLGKTTFVLDIARQAALKAGARVGIFSIEMSREQIIDRLISSESQVPLWKLRTGRISDDMEFQMIQHALGTLSHALIFIDDTPSPSVLQMRSMARRLQIEQGLDLIIVDYLQLIMPRRGGNDFNMVQQITEISRGLKGLARELNVPVIAVSQLSRAVDQREVKMPKLSDLRESGSIEQDADVVLFIYRKDRDRLDVAPEEQNVAQISIAKHRNGPLGIIDLRFDPERVTFKNIEKKYSLQDEGSASG